ncbi:glycosyl transferase [Clostridium folliculivorans]|uniref:Glycosyl transferase n=1 Tax=Clostridium folliculivorans TaxID=2886038 RepID=A0A9W5Y5Z2_9CLOT|nr:glycosyltransferase [Clostridium folliculivorans]GKU27268.1 glycosyl transferase [Clostridium folliculivorans]
MHKILYCSLVDWFWIKQRPHHFAYLLSEDNQVTYYHPQPWKKNSNTIYMHSKGDSIYINKTIFKKNNLTVIRRKILPFQYKINVIKRLNNSLQKNWIKEINSENEFDTLVITHPNQLDYIPHQIINTVKIVYDCMDNYIAFGNGDSDLIKNEKKLMKLADNIIVSSEALLETMKSKYKNIDSKINMINNGVDLSNFDVDKITPLTEGIVNKNKKSIGYIGTVSHWFDFQLIKNMAVKYVDIDFYIIGPVENNVAIDSISNISNIKILGTKPYDMVPSLIDSFDITIMPFVLNDVVKSVNPVKVYEYLALGKPVITTDYSETKKFGDLIYTYNSEKEFEDSMLQAFKENEEFKLKRIAFAKNNSWSSRVRDFIKFVYK